MAMYDENRADLPMRERDTLAKRVENLEQELQRVSDQLDRITSMAKEFARELGLDAPR